MTFKHPVSVLYDFCKRTKVGMPHFKADQKDEKSQCALFSFTLSVNQISYGPAFGRSKAIAKANVAALACKDLKLQYHSSEVKEKVNTVFIISRLHEYCRKRSWPKPKEVIMDKELSHDKTYQVAYRIATRHFKPGSGKSKEMAKKWAAARALAELESKNVKEYIRGPKPDQPFGQQVAECSWKAFRILCENLGESLDFCPTSNMAAFLLEDQQSGDLRVVSIGTGSMLCPERYRVSNGETIIDCHAVVVARRGLVVFLQDQLMKLLEMEESIFEYSSPSVAALKDHYELHLYMKNPPCGNHSSIEEMEDTQDLKDDHSHIYVDAQSSAEKVCVKDESCDIVSCSDKILLWNYVGVQGSLLSNFISTIYIGSITVTNNYSALQLVQRLCCRYKGTHINHAWFQHGGFVDNIDNNINNNNNTNDKDHRKKLSLYWTCSTMDLKEEYKDMFSNSGTIDCTTGAHLLGSARQNEIPIICKRNILIKHRTLCKSLDAKFDKRQSYLDIKNRCTSYKLKKNEFFKSLDEHDLGRFPIMDRQVDNFWLQKVDLKDSQRI